MRSDQSVRQFSRQVVEIMPLIVREFIRRESHELSRGLITWPQMAALDYAAQKKRVTVTDIAKALCIKTSSASVLIDRLIGQRMLHKDKDLRDRRVIWVGLTAKGRRVLSKIMHQKRHSVETIFGCLSARERKRYLAALIKIKRHIDQSGP